MQYDQSGNWTAVAGLIVTLLTHFGFNTTINDVLAVIGSIVIVVGLVRQYIAHKKLAVAAERFLIVSTKDVFPNREGI